MEQLNNIGYIIYKNQFQISSNIKNDFIKQITKKSKPIFNSKHNDNKRIQANLSINKTNKYFMENLKLFLNNLYPNLVQSNWVLIFSKPGCKKQLAHLDYVYDDEFKKCIQKEVPLLVLIALEPQTYLYLWEKSFMAIQNVITQSEQSEQSEQKPINPIKPTKITLDQGDILIFRADMVHAGSNYTCGNLRMHCYLDSKLLHRQPNRTWIISLHASEQIQKCINQNDLDLDKNLDLSPNKKQKIFVKT
jgi:hypothetical protein